MWPHWDKVAAPRAAIPLDFIETEGYPAIQACIEALSALLALIACTDPANCQGTQHPSLGEAKIHRVPAPRVFTVAVSRLN